MFKDLKHVSVTKMQCAMQKEEARNYLTLVFLITVHFSGEVVEKYVNIIYILKPQVNIVIIQIKHRVPSLTYPSKCVSPPCLSSCADA